MKTSRVPPGRRLGVQSLQPVFGDNYRTGFLGFFCAPAVQPSRGVTHFTGWARLSDVAVTGVFVVTAENECVEVANGREVVVSPLVRYFDDPKVQVFFRKPRKCAGAVGERIAATARAQAGLRVDTILRAARQLEETFIRRWVLSHFHDSAEHFAAKLHAREPRWLGAEFAAFCLDAQSEYAGRGILGRPAHAITPQELFEDEEIFAAWRPGPEEGPKPSLV